MEVMQRQMENIVVVHETLAMGGTRRPCVVIFNTGPCILSITHLLGSNTTREHLHGLIRQQRNLKSSSHSNDCSGGAEQTILKIAPIIMCTFKAPVTKAT